MKIGILALQGAFAEHENMLDKLAVDHFQIRQKKDLLKSFSGLILPGGESTVQGKLLNDLDIFKTLKEMIEKGLPVFATCAGSILLADKISNDSNTYFKTMPLTIRRNAYGRQLGSFEVVEKIDNIPDFPMVFIRAPYFETVEEDCEILSCVENNIVGVKYKNQVALSFHPELTNDTRLHEKFISSI